MSDLTARLVALAEDARTATTAPEAAATLTEVVERLNGPIRLAIAGKVKAGKSTLLNALIGEALAPTDAGECTRIVTWYQFSERPYARLHPVDGPPRETPYVRGERALEVDLGGLEPGDIDHLEIGWPTSRLARVVLIDTPGIASISTEVSARTHRVLSAESGRVPVADAVLYLLRHSHSSDLRFLESFHDDEVAEGTPVNTIGVLSRADEIGCARLDALDVAQRVARRYQADPRLHRLCPVVVPVDGLLGHAAATLREDEYAALLALARAAPEAAGELLLTADRFVSGDSSLLPVERRGPLLDRLGLFGVRLGVELLRRGEVSTSTELSERLAAVSGLDELRAVLLRQFEARARVLKARSAVAALQEIFRRGDCTDGPQLAQRLEEITSGAHEFDELRILVLLRNGELSLAPEQEAQLDRLMGGSGHDATTRLGLPDGATSEEIAAAAFEALATWQRLERHPLSSRMTQVSARAATRTLEGLLAAG